MRGDRRQLRTRLRVSSLAFGTIVSREVTLGLHCDTANMHDDSCRLR